MRMNRLQNHMQILTVDIAQPGKLSTLYDEQDKAYVEVPDTWQFITVGKGKKAQQQMLITSERDGYRHIYLYGMDGKLIKQVTSGEWEVCEVAGVDVKNQRLYYTSREHGAINKSLFVIGFDGKKKKCLNYSYGVLRDVKNQIVEPKQVRANGHLQRHLQQRLQILHLHLQHRQRCTPLHAARCQGQVDKGVGGQPGAEQEDGGIWTYRKTFWYLHHLDWRKTQLLYH